MKIQLRSSVLPLSALVLALGAPAAGAQVNCEAGVQFYANGGVKSCVLTGHHQFYTRRGSRLLCAHGKTLEQHVDGKLKSCILKDTRKVDGRDCAAGAKIEFDTRGRLLACK